MSSPPAASRRPTAAFAAVTMHQSDKLRFFQFPEPVHREGAGSVIRRSWPAGVQAENYHAESGAYEYKLSGTPFGSLGEAGGVGSRVLIRDLLAYLFGLGWVLDVSLAQSRDLGSKDTLVFRKPHAPGGRGCAAGGEEKEREGQMAATAAAAPVPAAAPAPAAQWLAVGLTSGDRLRLLGGCGKGPGDGDGEGTLVAALRLVLVQLGLFAGAQATTEPGGEAGYEFKLQHSLWRTTRGERVIQARVLILKIVEVLDSFG